MDIRWIQRDLKFILTDLLKDLKVQTSHWKTENNSDLRIILESEKN